LRWPQTTIAYASKAYLSPALCQLLLEEGLDLDVVSAGEWGLALAVGYPAARMHLHGNFKPEAELTAALEAGLGRIVVDSLEELQHIDAWAAQRQRQVSNTADSEQEWPFLRKSLAVLCGLGRSFG
jgi:diaminopimelate decarboxylase